MVKVQYPVHVVLDKSFQNMLFQLKINPTEDRLIFTLFPKFQSKRCEFQIHHTNRYLFKIHSLCGRKTSSVGCVVCTWKKWNSFGTWYLIAHTTHRAAIDDKITICFYRHLFILSSIICILLHCLHTPKQFQPSWQYCVLQSSLPSINDWFKPYIRLINSLIC